MNACLLIDVNAMTLTKSNEEATSGGNFRGFCYYRANLLDTTLRAGMALDSAFGDLATRAWASSICELVDFIGIMLTAAISVCL